MRYACCLRNGFSPAGDIPWRFPAPDASVGAIGKCWESRDGTILGQAGGRKASDAAMRTDRPDDAAGDAHGVEAAAALHRLPSGARVARDIRPGRAVGDDGFRIEKSDTRTEGKGEGGGAVLRRKKLPRLTSVGAAGDAAPTVPNQQTGASTASIPRMEVVTPDSRSSQAMADAVTRRNRGTSSIMPGQNWSLPSNRMSRPITPPFTRFRALLAAALLVEFVPRRPIG